MTSAVCGRSDIESSSSWWSPADQWQGRHRPPAPGVALGKSSRARHHEPVRLLLPQVSLRARGRRCRRSAAAAAGLDRRWPRKSTSPPSLGCPVAPLSRQSYPVVVLLAGLPHGRPGTGDRGWRMWASPPLPTGPPPWPERQHLRASARKCAAQQLHAATGGRRSRPGCQSVLPGTPRPGPSGCCCTRWQARVSPAPAIPRNEETSAQGMEARSLRTSAAPRMPSRLSPPADPAAQRLGMAPAQPGRRLTRQTVRA